MHYPDLFVRRENIALLRYLDGALGKELSILEQLRKDHSEKLELVRRLIADLREDHITELARVMNRVGKLVVRDRRKETKLEKIFKRIIARLEFILEKGKPDARERKEIEAIMQRVRSAETFINELVGVLQAQVALFKSSKNKFIAEKQLIKEFLALVCKEGRLFGYEEQLEKQVALSEKLAKDLEYYELATKKNFPDVVSENVPGFGVISGTLYFNKRIQRFRAGIVLTHGFKRTRFDMELLAKRLADLGYIVYSFDIPGHGESAGTFEYGLLSEFIIDRVKFMRRKFGVAKIGVLGYSVGAVGVIFASLGYSQEIERELYVLWREYIKSIRATLTKKPYVNPMKIYKRIEELISDGIKKSGESGARIDSIVLASPPDKMQIVLPPATLRLIASVEKIPFIGRRILKGYFSGLKTETYRKMANYLANINNVRDYMDAINYFSERSAFIRGYRDNIIFRIPKLLLIGKYDLLIRTFLPWRRRAVGRLYRSTGNCRAACISSGHALGHEGTLGLGVHPIIGERTVKLIVEFFDKHLPPILSKTHSLSLKSA